MHDKLTVTSKTSQSLICASELAQVTRRYYKILSAARASLDEAIAIGGLLVRIKNKLGHGNWLPWAEKNIPFSLRRAEYWMNLFENRQDRKFANASNLSSAYKLLAGPIIDVESEVVTTSKAPIKRREEPASLTPGEIAEYRRLCAAKDAADTPPPLGRDGNGNLTRESGLAFWAAFEVWEEALRKVAGFLLLPGMIEKFGGNQDDRDGLLKWHSGKALEEMLEKDEAAA